MRKIFRELVSLEEAKNIINKNYNYKLIQKTEKIPLIDALGRVVARDYFSSIDVPGFDRATMDGYAVKAEDTFWANEENPVEIKIIGKVEAGEVPKFEIGNKEAVEVSTGAVIPKGANAVVMVEYTERVDDKILVYKSVTPGENVLSAGSDLMAGELLVRKGTVLTAREIGMLSAAGISEVEVYKKPKVAVFSTGNEIISPGNKIEFGKIYDINWATICSAVKENGGDPIFIGIARDREEEIKRKFIEGMEIADIVISSGGTSAGVGDLVYRVINELGEPGVIVHGIAVKPGKPTVVGVVDNKLIFGLPGYPTSAFMIFELLVAPIIRKIAGLAERERAKIRARLSKKIQSVLGRREFLPVSVIKGKEGYSAYPVSGAYSAVISAIAESDGFIEIPENKVMLTEGEEVEVTLFSTLRPADLVIIGSHCIGIDLVIELMRKKRPWYVKVINVGSSGGLSAIRRGEADIAGTHLFDEVSGEYNIPYLLKFGIKNAYLIRGYFREQGLIVKKGNPKKIKGIEDLLRKDVKMINRNPGSGTRMLLDYYLKQMAMNLNDRFENLIRKINGYEIEAKSHTAVAVAVLTGKADVGLGIRSVAEMYGLDFIPLREEEYDFVIPKDKFEKQPVKDFIETLKSDEFKNEIKKRVKGIKPRDDTGEIVFQV